MDQAARLDHFGVWNLGAYEMRKPVREIRCSSRIKIRGIHFAFCGSVVDDPAGQAAREIRHGYQKRLPEQPSDHRRAAHSPKVVVRLARKHCVADPANRDFCIRDRPAKLNKSVYITKTSLVSTFQIITSIDVMTTQLHSLRRCPSGVCGWHARRSAAPCDRRSCPRMHALQRFRPRIGACRRLRA